MLKGKYKNNWELLFDIGEFGLDIEKPLTKEILGDRNHEITRYILYLYSMESFIYPDLN